MKLEKVYIVYETDAWHSYSERRCAGVYPTKSDAIDAIIANHDIEPADFGRYAETDEEFLDILREQLELYNQTQGFETNYDIDIVPMSNWEL